MTATSNREALEFAFLMGETGKLRLSETMQLMRLARAHGRLAEIDCTQDGGMTEKQRRRSDRIEQQISALLAPSRIKVNFGGDPRGYTVKLILPSGRYNTWGGAEDGWGVPQ